MRIMTGVQAFILSVAIGTMATGCWSHSESHSEFLGFRVGMSKGDAFTAVLRNQKAGRIRNLEVIDEAPMTYDEKYHGVPILPTDYPRLESFSEWHSGLSDCNCWVRLHFTGDRLAKIVTHEWTGPTE